MWRTRVPQIAQQQGRDDQITLDALHAFNALGPHTLRKETSRPDRTRHAFTPERAFVECARLLTAQEEVADRVCSSFDCPPHEPRVSNADNTA